MVSLVGVIVVYVRGKFRLHYSLIITHCTLVLGIACVSSDVISEINFTISPEQTVRTRVLFHLVVYSPDVCSEVTFRSKHLVTLLTLVSFL